MWCSNCQQDVPAVSQANTNRSVCSRCQGVLRPPHTVQICEDGIALDEEPCLAAAKNEPPPTADDWQLRQRTRELGRKLRHDFDGSRPSASDLRGSQYRLDPRQSLFDDIEQLTASPIITPPTSVLPRITPPRRPEAGQFVAWLFAFCGAIALGGGLGTIGWSLSAGRTDLWNLALGLTLAGQGILIFGLVLVVTRLWRNSRYATGKLQEVHTELGQLQRTADALAAIRSGGAPAFYAELVRGASPQMLLANLKGQIDQLATRLNGEM
jgi:hypothetical protein